VSNRQKMAEKPWLKEQEHVKNKKKMEKNGKN
jgi:hypothetical protein